MVTLIVLIDLKTLCNAKSYIIFVTLSKRVQSNYLVFDFANNCLEKLIAVRLICCSKLASLVLNTVQKNKSSNTFIISITTYVIFI